MDFKAYPMTGYQDKGKSMSSNTSQYLSKLLITVGGDSMGVPLVIPNHLKILSTADLSVCYRYLSHSSLYKSQHNIHFLEAVLKGHSIFFIRLYY